MFEEVLIKHVKKYPVLYNTKLSLNRDPNLRNNAWEEISQQLDMPVDELKSKWGKLRNCYTNALKRRRKPGLMRHGGPWKYERQMKYLLPFLNLKEDLDDNVVSFEIDAVKEEPCSDDDKSEASSQNMSSDPIAYSGTRSPSSSTKNENDNFALKTSLNIVKALNEMNGKRKSEMDEIDYFFLSMSKQIKKLPESDQADIKFKLHKLIYDAEKQHFNATDSM